MFLGGDCEQSKVISLLILLINKYTRDFYRSRVLCLLEETIYGMIIY